MKAILEFDLNDSDDELSHLRCVKALDMACLLFDIQNIFRRYHRHEELTDEQRKIMEEIHIKILGEFENHDINLETLVA